jgi:hypothetical protein
LEDIMTNAKAVAVCDNIDLLLVYQMHPQIRNLPREGFEKIYAAARGEQEPLTYSAARALLNMPPGRVAMVTGVISELLPHGESDGPIGAFVIARALRKLGHEIVFPLEDELAGPMRKFLEQVEGGDGMEIIVIPKESPSNHADLLPGIDAAISVERAGLNSVGEMHTGAGAKNRTGTRAALDGLIDRLNNEGKITVGIGDGGTEIGFGSVYEVAREVIPHGKVCNCPCGKGIITVTKTTHFLPASVSNWGAYALAAAMAILAEDASMAITPEQERHMLEICDQVDIRDGISGKCESSVDGIPLHGSQAMVGVIRTTVELALGVPYVAALQS